jgi:CRP-like cAMP-binding protein
MAAMRMSDCLIMDVSDVSGHEGVADSLHLRYDQNHMLPEPFHLLSTQRIQRLDIVQGGILFREGEPTNGLYICVSAVVHLVRSGPSGEPITIHRSTAGQPFAEASVFTEHFHCDAIIKASGQVLRVPKAVVLDGFKRPEFATAYNRLMSRQVQQYRQLLEIISIKSAKERVFAAMVAGLMQGTIIDLASHIALTHEATYRALRSLEQEGRIIKSGRGDFRLVA